MNKIGILGGGQLGRMFIQNALNYPVEIHTLDPNENAACRNISYQFTCGDYQDYDAVYQFGQQVDIIGIEIEHVNLEALKKLASEGKTVIPSPEVLEIIQDKGKQKTFYQSHNIPTAPEVSSDTRPVVQKLRSGGYDGRGVQIVENAKSQIWEEPSVFEAVADIKKELAVIVAKNQNGETAVYPVVEQVFNPEYNQLDYLLTPARIPEEIAQKSQTIAQKVVDALDSPGIFAVELFWNQNGEIWVNETAPRVHNSGHATIESAYSSQFDMMLRALLNLPLGSTHLKLHSAMLNLVGAKEQVGTPKIDGLQEALETAGAFLHWYGKSPTKPGRKMGHITVVGTSFDEIIPKVEKLKNILKVVSER